MYRKSGESSWATREIAALDFLLGIPLEAEREIVIKALDAVKEESIFQDQAASSEEDDTLDTANGRHRNINIPEKGGWWDAMIEKDSKLEDERIKQQRQLELETGVLERPDDMDAPVTPSAPVARPSSANPSKESTRISNFIPGRRLDGHEATRINVPREAAETELKTTFRTVARRAAEKEWENRTRNKTGLLDGRIFFSHDSSYPIGVFSVIRYDPKTEEEKNRRQQLEALGGGGTQFILPTRDWRGISYRRLFPRKERKNKAFNQAINKSKKKSLARYRRKMKKNEQQNGYSGDRDLTSGEDEVENSKRMNQSLMNTTHTDSEDETLFGNNIVIDVEIPLEDHHRDNSDVSSSSSEESTTYEPGFIDDPEMKKGKHRTEMVGDKVTGCIVSSITHYVSPADLKADLNRQFRQRFDQWEPPKSRRKYIGARVVDGTYKLIDPSENNIDGETADDRNSEEERRRKGSLAEFENLRMPPSLTLSKIRNLKQAALIACCRAGIEVSTVALACVYFERLAMDCRVDKSNRRLTFAACLLIAIKINESNVKMVHENSEKDDSSRRGSLKSLIKPRKEKDFLASLFVFFTHEWELTLKEVFSAEWGVFAALEFKLQVEPSHVTFHFKRLMKALEISPHEYLKSEMYNQWQDALANEASRQNERAERKEKRRRQREKKILKLQRELQEKESAEFVNQRRASSPINERKKYDDDDDKVPTSPQRSGNSPKGRRKGIFSRMGRKRTSNENFQANIINTLEAQKMKIQSHDNNSPSMHRSISSPNLRDEAVVQEKPDLSKSIHVAIGD